ncbi:Arylsulfatase [Thalassoglobus neptunius]|uniref:Arylsulfatase n=1 Tax=Thalassoglobus neptunius TaxID=1938619 RepID=A0A5C5X3K6_9PLAN|nr:sulfatase-like hydrolase/transferase [Thalassoglobus neptunius]TWT57440.1 Arylsulfatase [Thalassoglobus neptunius]
MNSEVRSRPNILWICSDQQRYDTIHRFGNSLIHTPNIDQIADHGISFDQAYCQSPVCSPSRASFLTGRYPRNTGCRQNGQTIHSTERLLPRILKDHGYRCGLAGKLHLSSCSEGKVEEKIDDGYDVFHWSHHPQPDWPENAYQQWLASKNVSWEELLTSPEVGYVREGVPAEYHQTTWCAEMAIEFIRSTTDQPWMFSVNMFDPHHPFDPPAEYLKRYRPEEMPLPKFQKATLDQKPSYQQLDHVWAHNDVGGMRVDTITPAESQRITAAYYAMVELIDDQVGRMIETLRETGQLDNTIVIFMSDHGEMLGDHGLYLKGPHFYEEAVHVPLCLQWNNGFQKSRRSSALVELTDLVPTLCEAVGIPLEEQFQGRSFLPLCVDDSPVDEHRDSVFCEYLNSWTHEHSYATMLRTNTHKIVVYHGVDEGELYDLESDPGEFVNLWSNPSAAQLKTDLMKQAFDRSVLSMDPLPKRRGKF